MATPSPPEPNTDDEFSAAFAELHAPAETPPTEPSAEPAPVEPPAADTPPVDTPPVDTPPAEPSAAPPPAKPPVDTPPVDPQVAQPAPDVAAQLASLQAELATLKKASAAPAPAPAPAPAQEAPPAPPLYSEDERSALAKYHDEWPDVAKGEALARRAEYQQLVGYIFEQLRPTLQSLTETSHSTSSRTQYTDLTRLVDDYDTVREPTLAWVATQPPYLRAAYEQVASRGTPEEVADLIGRFKRETNYAGSVSAAPAAAAGAVSAPASAAAAPAAASAGGGLAPAAAAAAASLRMVKSSRSEPLSAPDPNDFDGAFAEFVGKG